MAGVRPGRAPRASLRCERPPSSSQELHRCSVEPRRITMASGLLLGGAVAALLTAAIPAHNSSPVFDNPPPDKIVIDVATVNGSGCPAGTAAVAVSPAQRAFRVPYSQTPAQAA